MRGKRFHWGMSLASALGAVLGMIFMSIQMERATYGTGERILWTGAFFTMMFVFGFAAVQLAMALSRKYRAERPRRWWAAFLIACVLIFGIAAGGQYLFMYSREEITVPAEVDMVLLLDASGSMDAAGFSTPRTEAACRFVDSLTRDCKLQAVSFAGRIIDSTDLLKMNDTNKDTLKQMITAIDASGMTDFNEPLTQAMRTLKQDGREDCNQAVILLTDGDSWLDPDVVKKYLNSDIRVFTIRISESTYLSGDEQALVDFAEKTGGFDTHLMPNPDGSIDTADMLKAFEDAFEATSETKINMRDGLIVYSEDSITSWQFTIRVLVMMLCAMVIGLGYFGRISWSSLISSGVMGAAAATLVTVLESTAYILCALVVVVLVETAFVFMDLRGEDHFNV